MPQSICLQASSGLIVFRVFTGIQPSLPVPSLSRSPWQTLDAFPRRRRLLWSESQHFLTSGNCHNPESSWKSVEPVQMTAAGWRQSWDLEAHCHRYSTSLMVEQSILIFAELADPAVLHISAGRISFVLPHPSSLHRMSVSFLPS